MLLSANLLKLESSILPRVKRATNRNNVASERCSEATAPNCPAPKRRRRVGGAETYQTPIILQREENFFFILFGDGMAPTELFQVAYNFATQQ